MMGAPEALEAAVRSSLLEVWLTERSLGLVGAVSLRASALLSPSLKKSSERSGVGGS